MCIINNSVVGKRKEERKVRVIGSAWCYSFKHGGHGRVLWEEDI